MVYSNIYWQICCKYHKNWFFLWVILKDNEDAEDSKKKAETILIPLYSFYPFARIQSFLCEFSSEMPNS